MDINRYKAVLRLQFPNLSDAELEAKAREAAQATQSARKAEEAKAAPRSAPRPGGGQRPGAQRPGPKRVAAAEHDARAPYRFVPLNDHIVSSPVVAEDLRHDVPHPKGVSGTLKVTWTAETGFLIGVQAEQKTQDKAPPPVYPFQLAGRHVIPGSTLKGALRGVLAAVAGARLGRFNGHIQFGWRDFQDDYYKRHLLDENTHLRAGWLRRRDDGYVIDERNWFKLEMTEVARRCKCGNDDRWRSQIKIQEKQQLLRKADLLDDKARFTPITGRKAALDQSGGGRRGTVVVADHAPTNRREPEFNRKAEYIFAADSIGTVEISRQTVQMFHRLNSTPSDKRPKPNGAWAYWKPILERGDPIPVFFIEDESVADPTDPRRYLIGLTRLFRIPQRHRPQDVLANRHAGHMKRPGDGPDLVEGLFGHVDQDAVVEEARAAGEKIAPAAVSLRGRVSVGMAWCDHPAEEVMTSQPLKRVLMTPRPSFYPFYLQPSGQGYMEPTPPRLAGRKRYPVGVLPGQEATGRPVEASGRTDAVTSTLHVMLPKTRSGKPLTFTGQIRFHNLLPAELGALVWALTFGEPEGPYRHSIGRGKPLGLGQMRADVTLERLEQAASGAVTCGGGTEALRPYLEAFAAFMDDALRKPAGFWAQSPQVRDLRLFADPEVGRRNPDKIGDYPGDFKEYMKCRDPRSRRYLAPLK